MPFGNPGAYFSPDPNDPLGAFGVAPELAAQGIALRPHAPDLDPEGFRVFDRADSGAMVQNALDRMGANTERKRLQEQARALRDAESGVGDKKKRGAKHVMGVVLQALGDALTAAAGGDQAGAIAARLVTARLEAQLRNKELAAEQEERQARRRDAKQEARRERRFRRRERKAGQEFQAGEAEKGREFESEQAGLGREFTLSRDDRNYLQRMREMAFDHQAALGLEGVRSANMKDLERLRQRGDMTRDAYNAEKRLLGEMATRTYVQLVEKGVAEPGEAQAIATRMLHGEYEKLSGVQVMKLGQLQTQLALDEASRQQSDHYGLYTGLMQVLRDPLQGSGKDVARIAFQLLPSEAKKSVASAPFFASLAGSVDELELSTVVADRAAAVNRGDAPTHDYEALHKLRTLYQERGDGPETMYQSFKLLRVDERTARELSGWVGEEASTARAPRSGGPLSPRGAAIQNLSRSVVRPKDEQEE